MDYRIAVVLCLHVVSIYSAPMKVQVLQIPFGMQPQNPLMPLQNPFLRQPMPNLQTPFMYQQQPIMILLPNTAPAAEIDDRYINLNEEEAKNNLKSNTGHIDENKDAVIIDAEPNQPEVDLKQAVVLMPNGSRGPIGTIISYIPFLPIEINVPDAISWISGLIPQNWLGRPSTQQTDTQNKRLSNKGPMPVFMVPSYVMPQYK